MAIANRLNFILNGKRELRVVMENLKPLFESEDPLLLMTHVGVDEAKTAFSDALGYDGEWFERNVYCTKFSKSGYDSVRGDGLKRVYLIKMPNSLYHTISTAYNDGLRFVDNTGIARFVHVFADDCRIISDSYDPSMYERFMTDFSVPFVMDSKLNQANYAFKKYSPRFVFMARGMLPSPVSFVQYEAKDHFIVDRDAMKLNFDEKVKRMYIPELVIRMRSADLIRHTSFYPDPVLERWVSRDESMGSSTDVRTMSAEYCEDERYIKEELKESLTIENAVDPLIKEMVEVIESKGMAAEKGEMA